MAVQKFNPRHGLFTRMLEQKGAAIRKTAADTVRAAREHVIKSEQIVSQSMVIVERATKTLDDLGWAKRRRPGNRVPSAPRARLEDRLGASGHRVIGKQL